MSGVRNAMTRTTLFSLVLQATPSAVSGSNAGSFTITTNSTTVSVVTGGAAPFTYAWTTSGLSGMTTCTPNSPSSATTTFTCTDVFGFGATAVATCLVTETDTGKTATITVNITANYTGAPP